MEFCGVLVVKDVIQYHIMALLHPSDFVRLRQTCRTLRRIGSGKKVLRAAGARLYAILDRKTAYNMRKLAAKKAGSGPVSADELVLVAFQKGELCKASLLVYERATMRAVFATLVHVPELCAGKLTLTQNEDGFQLFRMVYENGELQELASRSKSTSLVLFADRFAETISKLSFGRPIVAACRSCKAAEMRAGMPEMLGEVLYRRLKLWSCFDEPFPWWDFM
jgi:hypothetical protein